MKKHILHTLTAATLLTVATAPVQQAVFASESDTSAVSAETSESTAGVESAQATIRIEGLKDHYHTGDEVELTALLEEATDAESVDTEVSWQWYIRADDQADWQAVHGLTSQIFSREATTDGMQAKAALLAPNGDVIQESEPVTVHIDDHHTGGEEGERIYKGFFYNDEVADRELSDWAGEWQSVYPYLKSGALDEVFEAKAAKSDIMDAAEYKAYYDTGYQTDVAEIQIEGDQVTFTKENGDSQSAQYAYDGYEILNYERGNRGVRFVFKRTDDNTDMPSFIQFSDHNIHPNKVAHFHLYWGDDRAALLDEVDHWPTYYPVDWTEAQIADDMLAH